MNTSPQWRDMIAAAGLPRTTDTKGACDIFEAIEGKRPSEDTVRRWDIPYRVPGRERTYEVDDVIAHARQRFERAPVRLAAAARRKVLPGTVDPPVPPMVGATDKAGADARTEARRRVRVSAQ